MSRFRRAIAAFTDEPPPQETPAPDNRSVVARRKKWWADRRVFAGAGFFLCMGGVAFILLRDPYSGARPEGPEGPKLGRGVRHAALGSNDAPGDATKEDKKEDEKPQDAALPKIDPKDIRAPIKSTGRFNRDQQPRREAAANNDEGEFGRALRVSRPKGVKGIDVPNPHLKMKPTTPIACAMNTFTDNGSGFVYGSCTVTREGGMNMTNTIPLIPAGSTIEIVGERQAAQGETRLFLTGATAFGRWEGGQWFEIDIMSAVADALGATGIKGYRDTQLKERLMGSVALGLVGDAAAVGQNAMMAGGVPGGRALSGAGNAAATSLRYSVNIPVHYKLRQGEEIVIVLNRYADFSDQIELEAIGR